MAFFFFSVIASQSKQRGPLPYEDNEPVKHLAAVPPSLLFASPWRERIKVRVCLILNAVYMEIPPWFIQSSLDTRSNLESTLTGHGQTLAKHGVFRLLRGGFRASQ
jgi:hypothetical protein